MMKIATLFLVLCSAALADPLHQSNNPKSMNPTTQQNLRGTAKPAPDTQRPAGGAAQQTASAQSPVYRRPRYVPPHYTVPGGRPTPTLAKHNISIWSLPLVLVAFLFVHFGDRKLPKWTGLVGCTLGLYGAHIAYGVLQEYVMTQPYSGPSAIYGTMAFPSVSFLVCANRIMATLFAFIVVKYVEKKPLGLFGGVDAEGSVRIACLLPSLTNVAATWFQYASLWYVTFPTQMLFKSLKLVPVLICSQIFMKRSAPFREWADALLISAGVVAFTWYSETDASAGDFSWKQHGIGMLMLLGFLLCDAVTPSLQKRAFSNSNLDAFQMMFWIGAASSVYAAGMLYFSGELSYTMSFLTSRPESLIDVAALSLIATLGQIFIYVTVQKHGPVTLSMIMTTRQIASVVISCFLFGHQIPSVAIGACALVFSVLLIRSYRSSLPPSLKSDDIAKASKTGNDVEAPSQATTDYPTGQSLAAGSGSSQFSSAFGLAKGFASKYSSKATALTGKLQRRDEGRQTS